MMALRRTYSAFVLIAVFVVGGLGAPVLHHLMHAHEPAHRHDTPIQAQDVDDEGGRLVQEVFAGADCELCAVVKHVSDVREYALRSFLAVEHFRGFAPEFFASRSLFSQAIRGPPVSS